MTYSTKKRRELWRLIEEQPPLSIYGLAQLAGRPYRRVHDYVHRLAALGAVSLSFTVRNGRRQAMIESGYSARLRRLDDMFELRRNLS